MIKSLWQTSFIAVIPMLLGSLLFAYFPEFKWNHELFHVFLESSGSLIAFILALFICSLIIKQRLTTNYVWIIACFVAMGILDLIHSQVPPGQVFVWLHSCATFIGGFFAALIWLPASSSKPFFNKWLLILVTLLSISFSMGSIFYPEMTLLMLDQNQAFTLSAEILNFSGGVGFLIAWAYFAKQYHCKHQSESFYFSNQFCLFGLAGILFEASILWDGNWWLWHTLRSLAFLTLAIYFARMYWKDIISLSQLNEQLNKKTKQLQQANETVIKQSNTLESEVNQQTQALKQAQHYTRSLIETSLDPLVTISPKGLITDVNNATEKVTGFLRKELIGTDFSHYFTDQEEAEQVYKQVFEQGLVRDYMLELKHKDGSITPVSYNASLYTDINDNVVGIFAAARDISQHIEAQRVKSEFLANMSHELRTPMNGVLGITELLSNTELTKIQKDYLETIQVSGETLLLILNDILDSSKMDTGEIFFQENDFDPNDVVEHIALLLTQSASNKGIELITEVSLPEPNFFAVGDPDRLRQILMNLANNAIKFTEQGEVHVNVKLIENNDRMLCRFDVHDTGIGIKQDHQKTLFEPFMQVDSSDTRKYMGTGLGLSICKKLVEAMDGEIGVESKTGIGSHFWFTLDLPCGGKRSQIFHHELDNINVLLVDDNTTNLKIVSGLADYWRMKHTAVANGLSALREIETAFKQGHQYDIAIIDHQMPSMDGIELIQKIKSEPNINDIKTILLTSLDSQIDPVTMSKMGIDGYIRKPARSSDLYNLISKLANVVESPTNIDSNNPSKSDRITLPRPENILVVEDAAINQMVIMGILQQQGFKPTCVNNGQEAVNAYQSGNYNLILMDLQMPVMDGYEATYQIRELEKTHQTPSVPIVALTANAMDGVSEKVLESGMDDYLTKPIKAETIQAAIAKWLPTQSLNTSSKTNEHKSAIEKSDTKAILTPILKASVLDSLEASLGTNNLHSMLSITIIEIEKRIETLSHLMTENNRELLKITAHGLKGESATLGALRLSETCKQMEFMAINADKSDIEQQMSDISKIATETITALKIRAEA